MKIVIIDDEINVRKVLKKLLLLTNADYSIVGEAASVSEAKRVIIETNPDIVLLDIELEDGTGFNLIDKFEEVDFKLIFITAYNQHAIKAFKFNAIDYLLKPIDPVELKKALEKAQTTISYENEIKKLFENFKENQKSEVNKIVIRTTNKTYFIEVDKILYCQSEGSYTSIVTSREKILASKNLKHFQDLLLEHDFIRTHQSYLVNKKYVTAIEQDFIILSRNISIPISLRRKTEIKALLFGE